MVKDLKKRRPGFIGGDQAAEGGYLPIKQARCQTNGRREANKRELGELDCRFSALDAPSTAPTLETTVGICEHLWTSRRYRF
jgi:hypothetical protein